MYYILLVVGLLLIIFFRQAGKWEEEWYQETSPFYKRFKPPRIIVEVAAFGIGTIFIVSSIYNLFDVSYISVLIILIGILLTRFYRFSTRIVSSFFAKTNHLLLPPQKIMILCLIIGIAIIVTGMMNLV